MSDYVDIVCRLIASVDERAMVVASPPSFEPGGHVTVVHAHGQAGLIDATISVTGLRAERIDSTRVMVFAGEGRAVIRPGPMSIDAGTCPGGVVLHYYRVPDHALLHTSMVGLIDDVEAVATADAQLVDERAGADPICMVVFDGDTGERVVVPGYATGDRLL